MYLELKRCGWHSVRLILYFINRRTNPDKVRRLEKKMRQPCKPELFKEHFDVLKTLLVRVANDCEQIRIILNYVEDKLVKEDKCVKRVQFTTL